MQKQKPITELTDAELLRYARQILLPQWDMAAQLKLKNSHVVIVGAGGLGTASSQILARAGVGQITIIDHDQIEESNLQRQLLFNSTHLGLFKADVAALQLQQINPFIRVNAITDKLLIHNAQSVLAPATLVLDGCDNFATRDLVNRTCVEQQIPLLSAAAIGFEGQMTLILPHNACYYCLYGDVTSQSEQRRCADEGVLASVSATIGALQAHHALLYLGLNLAPLVQKLLLWNGLTGEQKTLNYNPDLTCPVCQTQTP